MSRPTSADLVVWIGDEGTPDTDEQAILDESIGAALADVEARINLPDGDYPAQVRTAVLMAAARIYKRRSSPEGTETMFGIPVNVTRSDPDVEALIVRFLKLDGFY